LLKNNQLGTSLLAKTVVYLMCELVIWSDTSDNDYTT
jgi:hypothetical protein